MGETVEHRAYRAAFLAGRAYVDAIDDAREATPDRKTEAVRNVDMRWHDLVIAVGRTCTMCETGTCPGPIAIP